MSRTDTGTATIELVDRTGDFDPTNPDGAFFGRLVSGQPMGPMVQAKIELQHPVTDAWSTLFRGFIASIQWVPYRTEEHANVTLELVDGLALLAACEMAPDGSFGHAVIEGNIVYNEDDELDAVKTRIGKVLDEVGWPGTLRSIFTGNVALQKTVYAPRSTALSVIQDAADAEFPDMANVYISGPRGEAGDAPPGCLTFHGRYARFHPDVVEYDIRTFQLGDDTAAALDEDVVRVSPPLVASLDDTLLYTSALATPAERRRRRHRRPVRHRHHRCRPTKACVHGRPRTSPRSAATATPPPSRKPGCSRTTSATTTCTRSSGSASSPSSRGGRTA